jgi:GNAT superfamily N-acetyltransferase
MIVLEPLTQEHAAQVDALCAACVDYYQEVTGLPPGPAEAQSFFLAIPPHGDYDRKRLWGLFEADHLYGIIDGAFGHPRDGHFWIGLLLLEPRARGLGRGAEALSAIADHARSGGAHTLSLAVKSDYAAARRFWLRQGFEAHDSRTLSMPGLGPVRFDLMDRAVQLRPRLLPETTPSL